MHATSRPRWRPQEAHRDRVISIVVGCPSDTERLPGGWAGHPEAHYSWKRLMQDGLICSNDDVGLLRGCLQSSTFSLQAAPQSEAVFRRQGPAPHGDTDSETGFS